MIHGPLVISQCDISSAQIIVRLHVIGIDRNSLLQVLHRSLEAASPHLALGTGELILSFRWNLMPQPPDRNSAVYRAVRGLNGRDNHCLVDDKITDAGLAQWASSSNYLP